MQLPSWLVGLVIFRQYHKSQCHFQRFDSDVKFPGCWALDWKWAMVPKRPGSTAISEILLFSLSTHWHISPEDLQSLELLVSHHYACGVICFQQGLERSLVTFSKIWDLFLLGRNMNNVLLQVFPRDALGNCIGPDALLCSLLGCWTADVTVLSSEWCGIPAQYSGAIWRRTT